jgi:putative addiction module component (TIGR02574 family)
VVFSDPALASGDPSWYIKNMILPLHEMTVEEKLRIIEAIWEDLRLNGDDLESPAWQGRELQEREEEIASGRATFIEWEKAKIEIRQNLA